MSIEADQIRAREILANRQAIVTDSHLVYTSGKHGSMYVAKNAVYPYPSETSELCGLTMHRFLDFPVRIDAVASPVVGGVALSQWSTIHLIELNRYPVLALFADKDGDAFALQRGYDKLVKDKRVLVMEDVINTGKSILGTIEAVRKAGGEVVACAAWCNRGDQTAETLGVPVLHALISQKMDAWPEDDCPLCRAGVPINTDLGHGRAFLERKKQEQQQPAT